VIDWPWLGFFLGYTSISVVALYVQFRSNIAAMDKLNDAHERHVTDLREAVSILQLDLLHARETMTQARPNRVTHADLPEGLIGE
jgi:hypothetical protein